VWGFNRLHPTGRLSISCVVVTRVRGALTLGNRGMQRLMRPPTGPSELSEAGDLGQPSMPRLLAGSCAFERLSFHVMERTCRRPAAAKKGGARVQRISDQAVRRRGVNPQAPRPAAAEASPAT
jgi:hypothetical protein